MLEIDTTQDGPALANPHSIKLSSSLSYVHSLHGSSRCVHVTEALPGALLRPFGARRPRSVSLPRHSIARRAIRATTASHTSDLVSLNNSIPI